MQTAERKQSFINNMNQQIAVYNNLLKGIALCEPTISQFDNKAINARLTNAIKATPNPINLSFCLDRTWIIISDHQNRYYKSSYYAFNSYVSTNNTNIELSLTDNGRLDTEETKSNIEYAKTDLTRRITECKKAIADYDLEYQAWQEVQKHVEKYYDKFSHHLRGRIELNRK